MAPPHPPRALGAFGWAAFMRSGFAPGDEEMVAAKFEALGAEIERLESVYLSAVKGRKDFRQALRDERQSKP